MAYRDLREFIERLKKEGELKEIDYPVSSYLEITEIADRVVKAGGPALLFTNVDGGNIPVAINLFASYRRVRLAFGKDPDMIGEEAAALLKPEKPETLWEKLKIQITIKFMIICYTTNYENIQPKNITSDGKVKLEISDCSLINGEYLIVGVILDDTGLLVYDMLTSSPVYINDSQKNHVE